MNDWIFAGIDPGLSGAAAFILPDGGVKVYDCPAIITPKGQGNYHNRSAMSQIVNSVCRGRVCIAVLERVGFDARDDSHRRSAEVLIRTAECWHSLLITAGVAIVHLSPVQWRSQLGLRKGLSKSDFVTEAIRRFPAQAGVVRYEWRGSMVDKDGRAEALLLADLARILATGSEEENGKTRALQKQFNDKNIRSLAPNEMALQQS